MREIVEWLLGVEEMARRFYLEAAAREQDDKVFSAFLDRLADDEAEHAGAMEAALRLIDEGGIRSEPAVVVEMALRERIEAPLRLGAGGASYGGIGRDEILSRIAAVELSEWNDIFIYVIDTLKAGGRNFQGMASRIQDHTRRIREFMASQPDGRKYVEHLLRIPEVWRPRILVVDDAPEVAALLSALLGSVGVVETVQDGVRALRMTDEGYYDVIVTDVEMPLMDGIELWRRVAERDPATAARFLFFSSTQEPEHLELFERHNLRHLRKPGGVEEIRAAVIEIMREVAASPARIRP